MSEIALSVILPVFNVETHIERCIGSLQKQSFDNFEMIFVDDCGSDKSIEIVRGFAERDKRIKIIKHRTNRGTYFARKTGVDRASGNYIAFLDPDDEFEPNVVELLDQMSAGNPDLILFNTKRKPALKVWQGRFDVPDLVVFDTKRQMLRKIVDCKYLNHGAAGKATKREKALQAYNLLDVSNEKRLVFGEDQLLFLALIYVSSSAASIANAFYIYHENLSSITQARNIKSIKDNINQLDFVMNLMASFKEDDVGYWKLKEKFLKGLRAYRLHLANNIEKRYFTVLLNKIEIIKIKRSIKETIKLFAYMLTAGFINR